VNWTSLSERVLAGTPLSRDEGLAVLRSSNEELLAVVQAAFDVRRRHFGRDVNLHVLNNAKSGSCSENCSFCSQSAVSDAEIPRYPTKSIEELVDGAREAAKLGAVKYCMVISGRSPSERDLDTLCESCRKIKAEHVRLHLCVSPGLLDEGQARALKESGADRINHNLETSRRHFPQICRTHAYDDRVLTIRAAQAAGLEICCGGLMGMGEDLEDRVDLALALRELRVNSIPVNFLDPRAGTPLAGRDRLPPTDCLRTLAMFRFANPSVDIRAAGGREACLRQLQPLVLYPANSIFTEGYLTTDGQGHNRDIEMIADAGFRVAGIDA
jgi:biotin synthase